MNYLVDTCVLSELARPKPDRNVVDWFRANASGNGFYVAAITIGEIKEGIETLADNDPRKGKLRKWLTDVILKTYGDKVIDFDKRTAMIWGEIEGRTNRMGKVRPDIDAQIAATAIANGMTVLTRNAGDMRYTGAKVVNPF